MLNLMIIGVEFNIPYALLRSYRMESELLSCACGGIGILEDHRTIFSVTCNQCDVTVLGIRVSEEKAGIKNKKFWEDIRQSAIKRWNCIVKPAQILAELKEWLIQGHVQTDLTGIAVDI